MIRHLSSFVGILVGLLVLRSCGEQPPQLSPAPAGTVRIVSSLPSRGPSAGQARDIATAIASAVEARGRTLGGWRVEYVQLDGGSDESGEWSRERELANANIAANDPSVVAYIGPYNSGATSTSLPITNRARLLQASPSATWPGLTLPGWNPGEPEIYYPTGIRTFIRGMPPDNVQAEAAAQWASSLGVRRFAVLDDGSSYSAGMAARFSNAADARKIAVVRTAHRILVRGETEPIDTSDVDGIFYAPSSVAQAVSAARVLGTSDLPVFASDVALDPAFADATGNSGLNWHVVSNSAPPSTVGGSPGHGGDADGISPGSQFAANALQITNLVLDGVASGTARDRLALLDYVKSARPAGSSYTEHYYSEAGDPITWTVTGYKLTEHGFELDRFLSSGR